MSVGGVFTLCTGWDHVRKDDLCETSILGLLVNPDDHSPPSLPAFGRGSDFAALLRYGVVGATQNALMYGVTLLAIWAGLKAWQTTAILYPIATGISFAINRNWSFGGRAHRRTTLYKYVFLYTAMYPASIGLNWMQEHAGVPSGLASLNTFVVAVVVMFLAMNYWVFRK